MPVSMLVCMSMVCLCVIARVYIAGRWGGGNLIYTKGDESLSSMTHHTLYK